LSVIEKGDFDPVVIYREKTKAVKKSGLLDIAEADPRGLDAIGGLDALKSWIKRRRRVWSDEARAFGLPQPKGILLIGVPGTGKSLSAKSIGTALGVPTLRLDVGSLFNSLVGESEARTRDALKLAEALAPCVLWIDEIDKGLAGSGGSGGGDSGVTKRVFGSIISWMQERRRSVFMVATANDVTGLPPELLRKGRFDEIFAVDLPSHEERVAILAIHLKGRQRDPKKFDLEAIADVTDTFTGSEIEACLDEGLFAAFDEGGELETSHLLAAAGSIVPLAVTAKEQIEGIRAWAKSRARFASTRPDESTTPKTRRLG
jgi:SpoVK/Ycf46/Vps4 family AAA+-type ATPase